MSNQKLKDRILEVLPKDSIGRNDLFPVFKNSELFTDIIKYLSTPYVGRIDYVAAPEAIGWIMGSAMAKELNVGFVPLRKIDKLPYPKDVLVSQSYFDYSDTAKALELKESYINAGDRILIVDEWVETGISMRCCMNLLQKLGCTVVGLATIGIDYREETKDWIDNGFVTFIGKGM